MAQMYGKAGGEYWVNATFTGRRETHNDKIHYFWDTAADNEDRHAPAKIEIDVNDAMKDFIYLAGGSYKAAQMLLRCMNDWASRETMRADEAEKREMDMVAELNRLRKLEEQIEADGENP